MSIVEWTMDHFGDLQSRKYESALEATIDALRFGPTIPGVRARNDLMRDLRSLPVTLGGRRGTHILLFRIDRAARNTIEVMRILHDSMDFARHLPASDEPD